MQYFAVIKITQKSDVFPQAVVTRRKLRSGEIELSTPLCDDDPGLQLVELNYGVRRVSIYDLCSTQCKVVKEEKNVQHSQSLLAGCLNELQVREDGYPPRMA